MERVTWPFPTRIEGLKPSVPPECPANIELDPTRWVARCAAHLQKLVLDEGVSGDDLLDLAKDLAELPVCSALEPEAAAALHVLREA